IIRMSGSVEATVKKLKGARLRRPEESQEVTHAIGRGETSQDTTWNTSACGNASTARISIASGLDLVAHTGGHPPAAVGGGEILRAGGEYDDHVFERPKPHA